MTDLRGLHWKILGGKWMDKDLEDQIDAQFPKRQRRNSVLCPITGKETYSQYGLHHDVFDLIEDGLKYREMQANAELHRRSYHQYGYFGYDASVMRFVHALLGRERYTVSWTSYHNSDKREDRLEPEGSRQLSDSLEQIDLSDREAGIIVKFVEALNEFIERTKRDEFDRGHKLMLGLANGTVTIDEVNKANRVK